MTSSYRTPLIGLALSVLVFIWSGINPYDRATWWLEVMPVLIAYPLIILSHCKFRLTNLLYALIAVHAIILMIGGHYTYARVPFVEFLGEGRNNYDKIGHFAQGFIPAIAVRELLLRTSPLKSGKWLFTLVLFSCLGVSAVYELIEYAAAVAFGGGAEEFLGTQGDVWDTQKDMMWCGIGAATALLALSKLHDRFLSRLDR
jgi:putative membrane protein